MAMEVINPTTGQLIRTFEELSPEAARTAIDQSHKVFLDWRKTTQDTRAPLMKKTAVLLREETEALALLMAEEMGKTLNEGRAEVEKCALVCDYYSDKTREFLELEIIETDAGKSYVTYQPLGLVLAVMPWNFPFWQVFRFAAPALMAGNGGVLKHASNVPGCALAIEGIFRRAGFPEGLFRTLLVGSSQVAALIEHPRIKAVTLTGSTPAGKAVASKAGEMLKKTVLELGGSDPYVILEDADLDQAAARCAFSRLLNAGQSCIAAKRFIVVDSVREAFEKRFVTEMARAKMGDPLDEATTLGPQARHDLRDELHQQVEDSLARGARCILGGRIPESPGAFYPPTVLTDVAPGMPAHDQELFGPVAAIIPARDEADAIARANDSIFGLGAAVFTGDVSRGERIAAEALEAGCCFVNTFVRSDPRLPFGGIKESGYGRELCHHGIKEFLNIKTVFVD